MHQQKPLLLLSSLALKLEKDNKSYYRHIYSIHVTTHCYKGNHSTSDSNFLSFHPHPQWFKGFRMRPKWRAEAGMIGLWTGMASPGPSPSCHSRVSPVILRPALSFQWQQLEWHRNEKILIIRPFLKGLGLEWEILRTFGQNLHFSSEWVGMACEWVQNDKINQNDFEIVEWHQNEMGMIECC